MATKSHDEATENHEPLKRSSRFMITRREAISRSIIAFVVSIVVFSTINQNLDLGLQASLVVLLSLMATGAVSPLIILDFMGTASNREELAQERKIIQDRLEKEPDRIRPAWDLAQNKLESYFDTNVKQVQRIFSVSVVVMIAGFVLILVGIAIGFASINSVNTNEANSQINTSQGSVILAVVSSASGIIIEFIGATFIFLYRSTIAQALKYVDKLERMNNVGMAMQVLDSVSEIVRNTGQSEVDVIHSKIKIAEQLLNIDNKPTDSTTTDTSAR